MRRAPSPVGRSGARRSALTAASPLAALLLSATLAFAQINLASVQPLQVDIEGTPLISGWIIDPEPAAPIETWQVEAEGWRQVHHRWAAGGGSKLRQEVASRPDRLEITHLRLFEPDVVGVTYCGVVLPTDLLDGARFECIGSPRGEAERDGRTWSGTLGDGGVGAIKDLEYLRLHLPGGAVDFDCNPKGVWCPGEGLCPATERFALARAEDGWRLWSAHGKVRRGGLHEFKLVVLPARDRPVAEVHPPVNTRWTNPYMPTVRLNIAGEPAERYEEVTLEGAETSRDERFVDVQAQRVVGATVTDGELRLSIPVERDGVYLVSLLVGAPDRQVGPCTVTAGLGQPREMPPVAAGEYGSWALPGRAHEGAIEVAIAGNVRLVAAQAAPMMFENEDYHLERGWWVSTEFRKDDDLPL